MGLLWLLLGVGGNRLGRLSGSRYNGVEEVIVGLSLLKLLLFLLLGRLLGFEGFVGDFVEKVYCVWCGKGLVCLVEKCVGWCGC